jgi:cytoskeletal protein CcmA (bactofilin family)
MWKKDDPNQAEPAAPGSPRPKPPIGPGPVPASKSGERATIGASIVIQGDVSGDEDLLVEGRIEGTIDLQKNHITVGTEGKLKAEIHGRSVTIEGEIEGNVRAEEQIVLRPTAIVKGNIVSPRVTLEDGANFKGGIEMDVASSPPPNPTSKTAGSQEKEHRASPPKPAGAGPSQEAETPAPEREG